MASDSIGNDPQRERLPAEPSPRADADPESRPEPTAGDIERLARRYGLGIPDAQLETYRRLVAEHLGNLATLPRMEGAEPARPGDAGVGRRDRGHPPAPEEDPLGAWAWRVRLQQRDDGPLAGVRVALKDNVSLAGAPMGGGSPALQGHVPKVDATVVTRLLEAGAAIEGKAACEDLCFSGGSHTSVTGPVHNPHDTGRMTGGSSCGSAALVAAGEVDLAVGTDQGGSVVVPASWCGILGLKPTHGLVPYTGVLPVEESLDHVGFFARDVDVLGAALRATAGRDGLDPRQRGAPPASSEGAPRADETRWRVALLEDGFGWPDTSDPRVDETVREAVARRLPREGDLATARVPLHRHGALLDSALTVSAVTQTFFDSAGVELPTTVPQSPALARAFAAGREAHGPEMAATVKLAALTGAMARETLHDEPYAAAQNLRRELRSQVDAALEGADLLALPTAPYVAQPLPPPDASPDEVVAAAFHGHNAAPFNLGGHPTLSIPAGIVDGLPVGVLLVAPHGAEARLLAAARAWG